MASLQYPVSNQLHFYKSKPNPSDARTTSSAGHLHGLAADLGKWRSTIGSGICGGGPLLGTTRHRRRPTHAVLESPPNLGSPSSPFLQEPYRPLSPRAAKPKVPPIMPFVPTPMGPTDLMSAFLRNRIIFVGSTINASLAQRVISQLITLAAVGDEDIKMYINCPGGSTYSVLAIYDCMAWIKPDISTVAFGMTASQGAFLLAAGTKGKRLAMPNARIMIHQPQGGCGGTAEDVRRQVNEVMSSRDKLDKMFSVFTGQPVDVIQKYTERDRFFSAAEAVEFGLIDEVLETEY